MTIPPHDKPIDQLRQDVIDQLVLNYGHEKISKEAFERRLDQAYETDDHETLTSLIADLEVLEDPNYDAERDHMLYAGEAEEEASETIVNIFSGTHRHNEDIVPASIRFLSFMGGADIDYSMARFSAPVTEVKVLSFMGGVHIHVPEGVRVKTSVFPFMGGCVNKSKPSNDPHAPVIRVSGVAIFSGVSVGVKRSFRERMQSFADDIKEMLG